ncbi:Galactose-binding domain-containing protein [Cryptosporidium felis]|nr:Galactose-binding domain-containing protein [Cryptosporidium felis]
MNISGHSIINGLLSKRPESVLETAKTLLAVSAGTDSIGTPKLLLDYLEVSPSCTELLQAWSRFISESTTVKKNQKNKLGIEVPNKDGDSVERQVVIEVLSCISEIAEHSQLCETSGMNTELRESIHRLGLLVVTKYIVYIYRSLSSSSKPLIASSLRLLASISLLSKNHQQEILQKFNFNLPSFVTLGRIFERRKRDRGLGILKTEENLFVFLHGKRRQANIRIQYLRFILSFLSHNQDFSNILELLKIKNIAGPLFKNSIHYDSNLVSREIIFIFEAAVLNNENIPSSLKRSFFSISNINHIFENLVEMLEETDFRLQIQSKPEILLLERLGKVVERLIKLHLNVKTKDKVRIVFNWLKTVNKHHIKYPIVQRILVSIYEELTLNEKLDYFENLLIGSIKVSESKLIGILSLGFASRITKLVKSSGMERRELESLIIEEICSKDSSSDIEAGVKLLVNWIFPSFLNRLVMGTKLLCTGEDLFLNLSCLVILINISKRLFDAIEIISSKLGESKKVNKEYIINLVRQKTYQNFPELSNITSLLRYYFKKEDDFTTLVDRLLIRKDYFSQESLGNDETESLDGKSYGDDGDDDMFINITTNKFKKGRRIEDTIENGNNPIKSPKKDSEHGNLEANTIISNRLLLDYVFGESEDSGATELVKDRLRIYKVFLSAIKSLLEGFGNEFLLSMGYKFDNTKLILDDIYRDIYINKDFLESLPKKEYKVILNEYLYRIILGSLNISSLRYDWNCNKYLLFKFLESLIPIICKYQSELSRSANRPDQLSNIKFISDYLISMWITVTSKLNPFGQSNIFYYFFVCKKGKIDGNYSSFPNLRDEKDILCFQRLQFKLILLVNKTIFNYGILITEFLENYSERHKLFSKDFLKRNLDLFVLLLLLCSCEDKSLRKVSSPCGMSNNSSLGISNGTKEKNIEIINQTCGRDEGFTRLINTMNIKDILGQLRNYNAGFDGEMGEKVIIEDYLIRVFERRVGVETLKVGNQLLEEKHGDSKIENEGSVATPVMKSLLEVIFDCLKGIDYRRKETLSLIEGREFFSDFEKRNTFVENLISDFEFYYLKLNDTGFCFEFEIEEAVFVLLKMITFSRKEDASRLYRKILELNYLHSIRNFDIDETSNSIKSSGMIENELRSDTKCFLKGQIETIKGLENGGDRSNLIKSFVDLYMRLNVPNEFLFELLIAEEGCFFYLRSSLDVDWDSKKKKQGILNTFMSSFSQEFGVTREKEINEYLITSVLDNISNFEMVITLCSLFESGKSNHKYFLEPGRKMLILRLIEETFERYIRLISSFSESDKGDEEEDELFLLLFIYFIEMVVDGDLFASFSVYLSDRHFDKNKFGRKNIRLIDESNLMVPIEVFGFSRKNCLKRQYFQAFRYIMVNLFPYVSLRSEGRIFVGEYIFGDTKMSDLSSSAIEEYTQPLPIGLKFISMFDGKMELSGLKGQKEEKLFITSLVEDLLYIFGREEEVKAKNTYFEEDWSEKKYSKSKKLFKRNRLFKDVSILKHSKKFLKKIRKLLENQESRDFWEILNIFVFKFRMGNFVGEFGRDKFIILNSSLIFNLVLQIYLRVGEIKGKPGKNLGFLLNEITYLTFLLHYESDFDCQSGFIEKNSPDQESNGKVSPVLDSSSVLISSYSVLLDRFSTLIKEEEKCENINVGENFNFKIYYLYLILMPILMDELITPMYPLMMDCLGILSEKWKNRNFKDISENLTYLYAIQNYQKNESFYKLITEIKHQNTADSESNNRYPVSFIETSKLFINFSKQILDNFKVPNLREESSDEEMEGFLLLLTILTSTLYIAEIRQLKTTNQLINEASGFDLPAFVLLKLNRIGMFLSKAHQTLFEYLNQDTNQDMDPWKGQPSLLSQDQDQIYRIYKMERVTLTATVVFIFVEYLMILREEEESFDLRQHLLNTVRISKLNKLGEESLYGKMLSYLQENHKDGDSFAEINTNLSKNSNFNVIHSSMKMKNKLVKIILTNQSINLANLKLHELFLQENQIESRLDEKNEQMKLVKHWYHYYSIYLDSLQESDNSEFNWLNPNVSRLRLTLDNFPYNSKLINNSIKTYDTSNGSYDLGFVIPIINSRFKLAYSILRERGFHNSKNKEIVGIDKGDCDQEEAVQRENTRTCSGFIQDFEKLNNSRSSFNKIIDNCFIWLRSFCKNGALQILINSLSCKDFYLRFYSYQTLSLLFEIINFHYSKYIKRLREFEEEEGVKPKETKKYDSGNGAEYDSETSSDGSHSESSESDSNENDDSKIKAEFKIERNSKNESLGKKRRRRPRYIFKELPQIFMILNTLKNTVSGAIVNADEKSEENGQNCIRVSSFITRFLSDSVEIMFQPENKLYRQVNYFILSRSYLDIYDIPLMFNLLYSEDTESHSLQRSFILRELETSVRIFGVLFKTKERELDQEHDAINRRFIFPLLLNYVKTNNIYSQHDFMENTMGILKIILNTISDTETNFAFNFERTNLDQKCCDSLMFPNPLYEGYSKKNFKNNETIINSSIILLIQMINQFSLLDFIINLIRQISSTGTNYSVIKRSSLSAIIESAAMILIKITENAFIRPFSSPTNDLNSKVFYKFKQQNLEANNAIIRLLGSHSNSYHFFEKLLTCIKLLANSSLNPSSLRSLWINSYIGIIYCKKYILRDIESLSSFNELILNFQTYRPFEEECNGHPRGRIKS